LWDFRSIHYFLCGIPKKKYSQIFSGLARKNAHPLKDFRIRKYPLKSISREMGSKTKFSASEAAEAMNYRGACRQECHVRIPCADERRPCGHREGVERHSEL